MAAEQEIADRAPARRRSQQVLEDARQRFRAEIDRAPDIWQPALQEVASALFDPALELTAVRRRHKLMKPELTAALRAVFGQGLLGFVRRWRVETGDLLLDTSGLSQRQVATLVGFGSAAAFRAARRQARAAGPPAPRPSQEPGPPTSIRADRAADAVAKLRHFRCLALDESTAAATRAQLGSRLAHEKARRAEPLELRLARLSWERSRGLSMDAQRERSQGDFWFEAPAMFHHLRRLSSEEGRSNRRRGLELAQLALEHLSTLGSVMPEAEHSRFMAQAWTTLGNAHRLLLDYATAEEAFANAGLLLAAPDVPCELRAELACSQCELRRYQRRFADALVFAEQAVELSQGEPGSLVTALMCRGGVWWHLGKWQRATSDYEAAARQLAASGKLYEQLVAVQNLADTLVRSGRYAEAQSELERAKELVEQLGEAGPRCHTEWLEGLLASHTGRLAAAEAHLTTAREGLRALGEKGHFAIVSLDLAAVVLGEGRTEETLAILGEALPHLAALRLEDESLMALKLLQRAVAERRVVADLLEKVREGVRVVAGTLPPEPAPATAKDP